MKNLHLDAAARRHELAALLYRNRRLRTRYFSVPFLEPTWDMLLELEAARSRGEMLSIKSLSLASCVPATTALRYIEALERAGMVARSPDLADRRRCFVSLTPQASDAMAAYLGVIEIPRDQIDSPLDVQALLTLLTQEAARNAPSASS